MTSIEQAVKDLQDNLIVIAQIEKRQSEMLLERSQRIVRTEEQIAEDRRQSAAYQRRTDQSLAHIATNLDEMTDKLNGLIGYVSGQQPPSPPKAN